MSLVALKRRGVHLPTYGNWFTRAQRSHRGRKAWPGDVREWCGRTSERSERGATVARVAGPRRVSAVALRVPAGTERKRSGGPRLQAGLAQ